MMIFSAIEMGMKLLNYNIAHAMHAAKFTADPIATVAIWRQAHISVEGYETVNFGKGPMKRLTKRHKRG